MIALIGGREKAIELLLKRGADIKAVNKLGQTTLICAALFARDAEYDDHERAIEILKRVISLGVPLKAKDNKGKTALGYAKDGVEKGAADFLKKETARGR
jgi:ankyrin repeat protein